MLNSKNKSIIIIGAGVAGLSAGCYAQMNGYRTRIYEMHDLPGGLCTAWQRKGYTFDGCIHYLFGSGDGQPFNEMWQELGSAQGRTMINHSEYQRVTDGKQTLTVYTDPDRLEAHLLDISPDDEKLIRPLIEGVRQFMRFDVSAMYRQPREQMDPQEWARLGMEMAPFMPALGKWAMQSTGEYARRFKHPFLKKAVDQMFSWSEAPVMMGMMLLAYMHNGNAGFPAGGSLEFARALERRYMALGGEIIYKAQVERILTQYGRAVGVRLYDEREDIADVVISACDGRSTIFDMLGGEYVDNGIQHMYNGNLPTHQMVQVSVGIKRDLSSEPHWVTHLLEKPVIMAGEKRYELGIKNYCFDPSLAPAGKSVVEVMIRTRYNYWQRIYGRKLYDSEQSQVSSTLIDYLEQIYPGIRADIEVVDEATPLSYERYTGNWLGATTGWLLTKDTITMMIRGVAKTLPGLDDFYMAGQWVEPGGTVSMSAASGRNVVQAICKKDGKPFEVSKP